jgi:hypothetical protein
LDLRCPEIFLPSSPSYTSLRPHRDRGRGGRQVQVLILVEGRSALTCAFADQDGVTPAILAHTCDRVLVGAHQFLERINGEDLASALLRMLRG